LQELEVKKAEISNQNKQKRKNLDDFEKNLNDAVIKIKDLEN